MLFISKRISLHPAAHVSIPSGSSVQTWAAAGAGPASQTHGAGEQGCSFRRLQPGVPTRSSSALMTRLAVECKVFVMELCLTTVLRQLIAEPGALRGPPPRGPGVPMSRQTARPSSGCSPPTAPAGLGPGASRAPCSQSDDDEDSGNTDTHVHTQYVLEDLSPSKTDYSVSNMVFGP